MPHAPPERGVLTAWHTTLDAVHLAGADAGPRFDWDIDFRFDADLFDLGFVRANVLAQVETIVGSELCDVDPNQNNYTADFTLFFRLPRGELGATFHHVSRHVADRADQGSVSWNMVGVSYGERFALGPARLDAGVRALGTTERSGVDYTAQIEWYGALEVPLNPRLSFIGLADGVVAPVEREMFGRSVSDEQPILAAIDRIAAHCQSCSRSCSRTTRTARSRTSGEYRLGLPIDSILPRNGASRKPGTVQSPRPD